MPQPLAPDTAPATWARPAALRLALGVALAWGVGPAHAAALSLTLNDSAGQPLADAVALLEPVAGKVAVKPMAGVAVSQAQRQFNPRVTVVTVGTPVLFPNFDTVRHHVYSFSPTKTFEIKLYAGVPSLPVVFDKPGVAVLGCNIHDQMAAWIVVSDTPYVARSGADGRARIDHLPPGDYRLRLWHPALGSSPPPPPETLRMGSSDLARATRLPVSPTP